MEDQTPAEDTGAEDMDPAVAGILQVLWTASQETDGKRWSLARISKRAGVQMSVLRRVLTQLEQLELAETTMDEEGRGTAHLTEEGEALCAELFDGQASQLTRH